MGPIATGITALGTAAGGGAQIANGMKSNNQQPPVFNPQIPQAAPAQQMAMPQQMDLMQMLQQIQGMGR